MFVISVQADEYNSGTAWSGILVRGTARVRNRSVVVELYMQRSYIGRQMGSGSLYLRVRLSLAYWDIWQL